MTMTDKERFQWAERIIACKDDPQSLEALAKEGDAASHSEDDIAAILNIVQDLTYHDAAEELTAEAQDQGFYKSTDEEDNLDRNRN